MRAAADAGLAHVTLLEEPQAAFYAWLGAAGDGWRAELAIGDVVLVCDVGGGTTDFSLIAVGEADGNLQLERIAVGDHILLGGDNMDLALAHAVRARLAAGGHELDAWQFTSLTHSCRAAKETLYDPAHERDDAAPVVVLGRGSRVIGGSIKAEVRRSDVDALADGFFPPVALGEQPARARRVGLRELGLPFAADAAVTRHLSAFVAAQRNATAVLFNGGVMKARSLRQRIVETLDSWSDSPEDDLKVLGGTDLDLAVAHGAAYYGLVRRGRGVRIRGGTARAYYIGIESSMPVRGAVRHGRGHRNGGRGGRARARGRRAGRVPLPVVVHAARRSRGHAARRRARAGRAGAGVDRARRRGRARRRAAGADRAALARDRDRHAGALVRREGRARPQVETGVQRPRASFVKR